MAQGGALGLFHSKTLHWNNENRDIFPKLNVQDPLLVKNEDHFIFSFPAYMNVHISTVTQISVTFRKAT